LISVVVFHNLMKWYAVLTPIIGAMVAAAQYGAVLPAFPIAAHLLARDLSHGTIQSQHVIWSQVTNLQDSRW
jgi:hypothetical protein